ncbi:MAG: octaprenyl diphosphate synthase [Gammaproteobacteria bacterium]
MELAPASLSIESIDDINTLISEEMNDVNQCILSYLHSDVVLVNQIGHYIINSGGKRLRPVLHLLCSKALGYSGTEHINLAAIIEFIHTATLLHDDVVDDSMLRRGKETANNVWGNEASVLVGDFLYSRSFQMMVELKKLRIMEILSTASNIIAEGEVQQLLNVNDPDTTEEAYMRVIYDKTAKLFESAAQLAAVITERPDNEEQAMIRYGMHLGTAFQLIDDVLDYSASSDEIGKNIGDDLAEGKPTLPLIHAIKNSKPDDAAVIRHAIEEGGLDNIANVMHIIEASGAILYTADKAKKEAQMAVEAIEFLPETNYKIALQKLAEFSVNRSY